MHPALVLVLLDNNSSIDIFWNHIQICIFLFGIVILDYTLLSYLLDT